MKNESGLPSDAEHSDSSIPLKADLIRFGGINAIKLL
jgi:hypothetical protein